MSCGQFQGTPGGRGELVVEEAKQALETDKMPVEDIAASVGYEDAASFRRVFKRRVDLTPAAYRRKFQRLSEIAIPAGMAERTASVSTQ